MSMITYANDEEYRKAHEHDNDPKLPTTKKYGKLPSGYYPHECCTYLVSINGADYIPTDLQTMINYVVRNDTDVIRVTDTITYNTLFERFDDGSEYCITFFRDIFDRRRKKYRHLV